MRYKGRKIFRPPPMPCRGEACLALFLRYKKCEVGNVKKKLSTQRIALAKTFVVCVMCIIGA